MLRWRHYRTALGRIPVRDFLFQLAEPLMVAVAEEMRRVAEVGLTRARHIRGAIYELRVQHDGTQIRILFAQETKFILLSLVIFRKKTKKTPVNEIEVAQQRLDDWRERGKA
jgi:phage-related protein